MDRQFLASADHRCACQRQRRYLVHKGVSPPRSFLMAVVYIRRSGLATPTLSTLTTKSKKSPRTGTVDFSRVKPLFSSIRQIWPQLFIRQISNTKKNNHWWLITSYLSYLLASYLSLCGFFSVVVAWRDGYWESKWEAILSWCYDPWPKDCIVTFSNFQ